MIAKIINILQKIKFIWDTLTFRRYLQNILNHIYPKVRLFSYIKDDIEFTSLYLFSKYIDRICLFLGNTTLLIIDLLIPLLCITQGLVHIAPDNIFSIFIKQVIRELIKKGGEFWRDEYSNKHLITVDLSSDERYLNLEKKDVLEKLANHKFRLAEANDLFFEHDLNLFSIIAEIEELLNAQKILDAKEVLTPEELVEQEEIKEKLRKRKNQLIRSIIFFIILTGIGGTFSYYGYSIFWFS